MKERNQVRETEIQRGSESVLGRSDFLWAVPVHKSHNSQAPFCTLFSQKCEIEKRIKAEKRKKH